MKKGWHKGGLVKVLSAEKNPELVGTIHPVTCFRNGGEVIITTRKKNTIPGWPGLWVVRDHAFAPDQLERFDPPHSGALKGGSR